MEYILTMANLKLKPFLFMPRPINQLLVLSSGSTNGEAVFCLNVTVIVILLTSLSLGAVGVFYYFINGIGGVASAYTGA